MPSGRPDTRTRIVDGTAEAVQEHGLRSVTVQHILSAAGLSRRTFYQHFRNKDDACLALYERVVERLITSIREAVEAAEDPGKRLFAGLDAYLDFQEAGGELVTQLQAEAATPRSLLTPLRERTIDALVEIVDTDVRAELDIALEPLVYRTLFLGLEGLVIHCREAGGFGAEARQRVAKVIKAIFLRTLVGEMPLPTVETS